MSDAVELLPAVLWLCPNCCAENFVRIHEASPEDYKEFCALEDIEEADVRACGFLQQFPTEVTCPQCKNTYEVEVREE